MKRFVFFLAAVMCGTMLWADTIVSSEMSIRYYMPKTEVTISMELEETHYIPGKYARWADELLDADDAITEDSTSYSIREIQINTTSIADHDRVYYVRPQAGVQTQWLSLTQDGILYGYNEPYKAPFKRMNKRIKDTVHVISRVPASVLEETIKKDSLALQARSVAKQIYQLRDNRIYLLSGDVENAPADGASMKVMLTEIDRQEKSLVKLFMGKEVRKKVYREVKIDPTQAMDSIVMTIGDDSIRIVVEPIAMTEAPKVTDPKAKKKKDAPTPSQIYYNLPGTAHIIVETNSGGALLDETIQVAQLGISIPLPLDLFNNSGERVKIRFDEKTGSILSIRRE